MAIYVGIVTYNSVDDLPMCFNGLISQTVYDQMQIVVLDNVSTDDSIRWLQQNVPHIHVIKNDENVGFGRGHNRIIQYCNLMDDDFYLALNPDAQLDAEYLQHMIACLRETGAGWGIGKLLSSAHETPTLYSVGHALLRGGFAFNIGQGLVDTGQYDVEREVFGAPGAAMVISGQMIQALAPDGNLFDPSFFLYYEDVDLDWVARRHGWRCWYQPLAIAYHRGSTPASWLRDEALCNRYLSVVKNSTWPDLIIYAIPLMLMHMLARLVLQPQRGGRIIITFLRRVGFVWQRRQPSALGWYAMHQWFRWSSTQPTSQPITLQARIRDYRRQSM